MRKYIIVLFCTFICILAVGDGIRTKSDYDEAEAEEQVLTATIVQIDNNTMFIRPVDGSFELGAADIFAVSLSNMSSEERPVVGDGVEIKYQGGIEEIYPATLCDISSIKIVTE